jgi:hypothetical protein
MKKETNIYIILIFLLFLSCKNNNNTIKVDEEKNNGKQIDNAYKSKKQKDIYINNEWNGLTELVDVKSLEFEETSIDSISYGLFQIRNSDEYIFSVEKFLENPDVEQYRTIDTVNLKSKDIDVKVENFSNYKTLNLFLDKKLLKKWKFKNSSFGDWKGNYDCNFLRMKGEYADPRAYGMIYININNNESKFKLDTYVEIIDKDLIVLSSSPTEIILSERDNIYSKFTITKNNKKYELKSDLLNNTVGETAIYKLVKK